MDVFVDDALAPGERDEVEVSLPTPPGYPPPNRLPPMEAVALKHAVAVVAAVEDCVIDVTSLNDAKSDPLVETDGVDDAQDELE